MYKDNQNFSNLTETVLDRYPIAKNNYFDT